MLLARTVTPEPMRPGWPQAMRMSASALPFRRMLSIDQRLEHAAARPVIIPQVIVVDHGKVFISESFRASCEFLGVSLQPARKATGTDKPHIERMLGSVATMFSQYVSGYTGRSPEYRGRGIEEKAVWSLHELQDLLDQWLITWQNRPHDGLRDPLHPGRAFSPNEKYAALTETAGYVPLALSPDDYIELLPATWRAVNAYGIKISRRIYDGKELNPLRMQHSGVTARKGLHEVHYDPLSLPCDKGSYADLGIIPMFTCSGRRRLPEVGIMQAARLVVFRCGEAVEEVENGVAGLVASQLLFGHCGAVKCPFLELQVGMKVLHR